MLSIQVGFLGYYILNLPLLELNILSVIFIIFIIIAIYIFLYTFLLVRKFTTNGDYGYLPYPNIIKDYINDIENAELDDNEENKQFNEFLYDIYCNIALKNTETNEIRQSVIIKIRNILIVNIIILMVMFIPYFILSGDKLNSHKVILMGTNKSSNTKELNDNIFCIKIENININYCKIKQNKEKVIMENNESEKNASNQIEQKQQVVQQKVPPVIEKPTMRVVTESYDPTLDIEKLKKQTDK